MLGDVRRLFTIAAVLAGASGCGGGAAQEASATPARAAGSRVEDGTALPARAAGAGAPTGAGMQEHPKPMDETAMLERLVDVTPKESPDHPALLRRLAEKYVEIEAASQRGRVEAEEKRDAATARKLELTAASARDQAIKYYTQLKDQHPGFCQQKSAQDQPGSGCIDEVLYYLAYEYEQANRLDEARKVYLELVKNFPSSKFVPNAYLAFAERFFDKAASDPSAMQAAEQAYRAVMRFPPPDNKVWGYARYKLAYVYWNTGDYARALGEMKAVIEYGTQYPTLPNASKLAATARHDITSIYALAGEPAKAFDFLRPLSGDGGGEQQKTLKMMNELGHGYLDAGMNKAAVVVYIDLIKRSPGGGACASLAQLDTAAGAAKLKSDEAAAVQSMLAANRALLDRARAGCAS